MKIRELFVQIIILLSFFLNMGESLASDYLDEGMGRKKFKLVEDFNQKPPFPFMNLPRDIKEKIFPFISFPELLNLKRSCSILSNLIRNSCEYSIVLHYGIHVSSIEPNQKKPVINFSKNGKVWSLHPPISEGKELITDVERLSLAKFNDQLYAAILREIDNKPMLQVLSCMNGISWKSSILMEAQPLDDLQLATFQGKLWLAYIPSATQVINLVNSEDGREWGENSVAAFPPAKRLSLASFQGKLFMAYALANHPNGDVYVVSSDNGKNWVEAVKTSWGSHNRLQLISYQNKLRLAHTHTNRESIEIGSSYDGRGWNLDCHYNTPRGLDDLNIYIFRKNLCIAYFYQGASNSPFFFSSSNGKHWGTEIKIMISQEPPVSIAEKASSSSASSSEEIDYSQKNLQNFIKYLIKNKMTKTQISTDLTVPSYVIAKIIDNDQYKPRSYSLVNIWNKAQTQYAKDFQAWKNGDI